MAEPLVVVGGSVAGLVAAREAARLGRAVELLVPGGRLGGGFLDLARGEHHLRAGVRLLELTYGDELVAPGAPAPSLEDYAPGPAGHVPHMRLVRRTILELVDGDVRVAPVPRLAVGGRIAPDPHMTADLRHVRALLPAPALAAVAAEAAAAEALRGPAGVLGDPTVDPWSLPFEAASVANHGPTFHRLVVAPVAAKIVEGGAAEVATALRRKAWLALFHPRTLREAAEGGEVGYRPWRPFHVDASGGCSAVVAALVDAVRSSPAVRIRTVGRLGDVTAPGRLRFDDGTEVAARRPIVAVAAAELFAAAGAPVTAARAEVGVTWADVAADDVLDEPSAVLLADPDLPAYRVGAGGTAPAGRALFAIEHGAPEPLTHTDVERALVRAGVVGEGVEVRAVHQARFSVGTRPSPDAAAGHAAAAAAVAERAPWLVPVAGGAAPAADSFNEQVVAGLHAGRLAA